MEYNDRFGTSIDGRVELADEGYLRTRWSARIGAQVMAALLPFLVVGIVIFFAFKLLPHFVRRIALLVVAVTVAVVLLDHDLDLAGALASGQRLFGALSRIERSVSRL